MLRALALIPALALMLLGSGCDSRTEVEQANEENILLVGNAAEPKSLDPHKVTGVTESNLLTTMFEGLVNNHPSDDDTMVPGVATSWESNKDFTEWTFHLRHDAKWSDGEPLTSADFNYTYRRMLTPVTAAPYASMLYDFIEGAKDFQEGKTTDWESVGVKTPDPYTLVIRCREPVPFLPAITSHLTWVPLPRHVIEAHGGIENVSNDWANQNNLIGNGPFMLKDWRLRAWIEVRRNPHYWDAANVGLEGIRFFPIESPFAENRAFLAKQLHLTYTCPPDLVTAMKRDYPREFHADPYVGSLFIRINSTRPVLSDPRVREALSLVIDRQSYADNVAIGYSPATAFTPRMGDYFAGDQVVTNVERARQLLAEAGYPNGEGFPRISLLMGNRGGSSTGGPALQAMWAEALGVHVDIRLLDWTSYLNAQQQMDYDIATAAWIGDYLDPTTFLNMWTKGNGNNNTGWDDPEYERLLAEAAQAPDAAARYAKLAEAETRFLKSFVVLPIAWYTSLYMMDPAVKGYHPLLLGYHPWKTVRLEPAAH